MSDPASQADQLRAYLDLRDEACPNCTYNLRGLAGDRCPECHERLTLSVNLAEPRTTKLLLTAIGLTFGAAPCAGMVFISGLFYLSGYGSVGGHRLFWQLVYPGFWSVVLAAFTVLLCRRSGRRWFRRRSKRASLVVVLAAWAISCLVGGVFVVAIVTYSV